MRILWRELKSLWGNHFGLSTPLEIEGHLSEDDYFEIEKARGRSNIQRILSYSCVLIPLEIVNIFLDYFTDIHKGFDGAYFWGSSFLILAAVIHVILIRYHVPKNGDLYKSKIIYHSFWFFYIVGSLMFCYIEILERRGFTNYVLMLVVLAIIPALNWREMLAFACISFLAESALWYLTGFLTLEYQLFSILIAVMAFVISHMLSASFMTVNIAHRQLLRLAQTDPLTQLLNRRGFEKKLEYVWPQSIRCGSHVMVAVVDIDSFKSLNDRFGHVEGDQCLIKIAENIGIDFKRTTDIVARFGGEEFIIFASHITNEKTIEFLKSITARIEGLCIAAGDTTVSDYVTVSIGAVSAKPTPPFHFEQLYELADRELAKAKRGGKNCISFNGGIL